MTSGADQGDKKYSVSTSCEFFSMHGWYYRVA